MPDEAPPSPTPFPLDSLPAWQRSMVEAVATATKSDAAISAMMSLAVLSAAVGRKVVVETDSTMTPPTNIWVLVVAGTGQKKTPIFGCNRSAAERRAVRPQIDRRALWPSPRRAVAALSGRCSARTLWGGRCVLPRTQMTPTSEWTSKRS